MRSALDVVKQVIMEEADFLSTGYVDKIANRIVDELGCRNVEFVSLSTGTSCSINPLEMANGDAITDEDIVRHMKSLISVFGETGLFKSKEEMLDNMLSVSGITRTKKEEKEELLRQL